MTATSKWTIDSAVEYTMRATYKGLKYWSAMDFLKLKKAGPYAPVAVEPAAVKPAKAKAAKMVSKKHSSAKRGSTKN